MTKAATAYLRGDRVFVHAAATTTDGVRIVAEPVLATTRDNPAEIGRITRECLSAYAEGVPHPATWGGLFQPVLALAGVKSYSTFVKTAESVDIEQDGDELRLIPLQNHGAVGGYSALPDRARRVAAGAGDDAIGRALLDALGDTE